jgi:hypothetical protein
MFAPTATLSDGEKIALAVCLIISGYIIARLWLNHRSEKFIYKLLWSIVLLMPVVGWVFYGAFYTPSDDTQTPISPNDKHRRHDTNRFR